MCAKKFQENMFLNPVNRLRLLRDVALLQQQNLQLRAQLVRDIVLEQRRRRRRRRRMWVRQWLQRRGIHGQYERLMRELSDEDMAGFRNFIRMEPLMFHELLDRIVPRITKKATNCR